MSNKNNLQSTLERLSKLTAQNQGGGGSTVKYWKPKKGKNNLLVLTTEETGDPFLTWGEHKNLMDVSWKTVPCTKQNKNEECIVCQVIEDLQKQNWKGNFKIWKPIELKIRYFSPVVDLDDIDAGLQWWGYGKSVLGQFENWLINLEEDEKAFYDNETPEKVVVNYDPDTEPSLMYKLEHKALKAVPAEVADLRKDIKPLVEIFKFTKTKEELGELLEAYMTKIQDELENEIPGDEKTSDDEEAATPEIKKLGDLKGKAKA